MSDWFLCAVCRKPRRSLLVEHAGLISQLTNCLKENESHPLLCSKLAKEFIAVATEAQKEAAVS